MEETWIIIASAEGAIILFLGGLIAKAIFKMSDSIQGLTQALTDFVKKDDCKTDMGEHCGKIETLEYLIDRNEKALAELKAKAEIWHG
jgi:hypothetical protein